MNTIIDMVKRKNAEILDRNPTIDQLQTRLQLVTDELEDAYRTIDRLRAECAQALNERNEANQELDEIFDDDEAAIHKPCIADLKAQKDLTRQAESAAAEQKQATWNARVGESIAVAAALAFAALVIAQSFN